jgi:hypothetical protein
MIECENLQKSTNYPPEFDENIVLFTDDDQEGVGDPEFENIVLFTDSD